MGMELEHSDGEQDGEELAGAAGKCGGGPGRGGGRGKANRGVAKPHRASQCVRSKRRAGPGNR